MDDNVPEGFRMTEIGLIPAEWAMVKLEELVTRKITDGTHKTPNYTNTGIPFVTATNLRDGRIDFSGCKYISRGEHDTLIQRCRPENGDILLSKVGTLGLTARVDTDIDFSIFVQVALIKPRHELIDSDFLKYSLSSVPMQQQIHVKASQSTMKYIGVGKIAQLVAPLPSLPEQKNIAAVLSAVQEAKEKTEDVIEAARELKKSLMKHLFTYGPVSPEDADKVPLKETEIGLVPEEWELVRLEEVIADGPQNGIYKHQSLYGAGPPIVRIDDYENEGSIVTRASNRVQLTADEVSRYTINTNDILINRVNSLSHIGKTALVGELAEPMVFESNMMRLILNQSLISPEYMFRYLTSPSCRRQMVGKAKRAVAQSSINQGDVKSIIVPLLPLSIQKQIANILSAVDSKIEAEENRKQALEELFRTLLNNLMTGRIRVNNLDIEPTGR